MDDEELKETDKRLKTREEMLDTYEKILNGREAGLKDREKEISDTAYRKGFNVGVLGLTKQLMGLFSEARVKEYGEDIPVLAVRTFILAYSAGLIGSSHEDDIDELGNTFNGKMEDIIKEVEKML